MKMIYTREEIGVVVKEAARQFLLFDFRGDHANAEQEVYLLFGKKLPLLKPQTSRNYAQTLIRRLRDSTFWADTARMQ